MNSVLACRSGAASDLGHERTVNEDRILVDEAKGVFLVVDGMGGHAAGELAAETARRIIEEQMRHPAADVEVAIRHAITEANNRIYDLAQTQSEWHGMACVLTLAVAHDDRFTVGHVGDSRLYLSWNGNLKKITSDHSLVGEKEDCGELTEQEAMAHPRRHEVLRDVGSRPRGPDDAQFIETKDFMFRPDAAVLICTDGLSDVLTSAQMKSIIERYDGDPAQTAQLLTKTANESGGPDNISVVFIAGPDFLGSESPTLAEAHVRHSATRVRDPQIPPQRAAISRFLWLITGMVLGALLWNAGERLIPVAPASQNTDSQRRSGHVMVDPSTPSGLATALAVARPGDTIDVPPGQYTGPLNMKDHVSIRATVPGRAVIVSDPASEADPGLALTARGVSDARVTGLRIIGDEAHPLRVGALISSSSVNLEDVEVSGAVEAGIRIEGSSDGVLLANFVHANLGPGIIIGGASAPRLAGNWITDNGKLPATPHAGIEILPPANPVLENNLILGNGVSSIVGLPPGTELEFRNRNFLNPAVGAIPAQKSGKAVVSEIK